jgi:hypothetical protein
MGEVEPVVAHRPERPVREAEVVLVEIALREVGTAKLMRPT